MGKKGGGTQTTTTTVQAPPWVTQGLSNAAAQGQQFLAPYFQGKPLTADQESAANWYRSQVGNNAAVPALSQAATGLNALAGGLQDINRDYLTHYADKGSYTLATLAKNYPEFYREMAPVAVQSINAPTVSAQAGAQHMAAYQNPYTNDVINASLSDLRNAYQKTQVGSNMAAAAAGAFGGGRHGIRDAAVADDYLRNVAGTTANLRNQGFNTAAGLGMQDANRFLSADTANAANSLTAQQFNSGQNLAAQQYNNTMQNQREMFDVNAAYQGDQQRMQAIEAMQRNLQNQAPMIAQAAQLGVQGNELSRQAASDLFNVGTTQFQQPLESFQASLLPYQAGMGLAGSTATQKTGGGGLLGGLGSLLGQVGSIALNKYLPIKKS